MRPKPDPRSVLLFYLLKKINKCHREYQLLQDGDRIALALSGGKDSCTLLDALVQRKGIERYTVIPIHITPASDMDCGAAANVPALRAWLDGLGVEYHIVAAEEPKGEPERPGQHPCFYCAWRRRKALFNMCRDLGCNKLALAHNADDVAQTTLMNLFYQSKLTTMYPRVPLFGGNLIVIRPLAYVPEKEIVRYAQACDFPPFPPACESAQTSKRALMRDVLRLVQDSYPKARTNLWRAVQKFGDGEESSECISANEHLTFE
ncbi:MAG: tRNA 2-thiocytidine biosynthesis protein TtcA [Anaerolineae bacterium]|nr:tRNA 2-thiocytidine biosynthesis protein TtcA [Anaerolineae bacterium]